MRDDSGFYIECLLGDHTEELGNIGAGSSSTVMGICSVL